MLGSENEIWEQTELSLNENVEMGKRDHTINNDIGKEAHTKPVETFLENRRLVWFGYCSRREHNHICAKIAETRSFWETEQRSTEKRDGTWRDNIKEGMQKYQLIENMAHKIGNTG